MANRIDDNSSTAAWVRREPPGREMPAVETVIRGVEKTKRAGFGSSLPSV
jgi:hypothetical protein